MAYFSVCAFRSLYSDIFISVLSLFASSAHVLAFQSLTLKRYLQIFGLRMSNIA